MIQASIVMRDHNTSNSKGNIMRLILTFEEAKSLSALFGLANEAGLMKDPPLGLDDMRAMALVSPSWIKIQEDQGLVVLSVDPTLCVTIITKLTSIGQDNMALFKSAVGLIEVLVKNLEKGLREVKNLFH